MKTLFTLLSLLTLLPLPHTLTGSETAMLGDFFTALGEKSPRIRAEALLVTVEKYPAHSGKVMFYLEEELAKLPVEKNISARLLTLWKKNPAGLKIALLAFNYARRAGEDEKVLLKLLSETFSALDFSSLRKKSDMLIAFKLANDYLQALLDTGNFTAGDEFFNRHLPSDGKCGELLLGKALHFYWIAAFRNEKRAPHFRDYGKKPGFWERRYEKILSLQKEGEENLDYEAASARLQLYLSHRLPYTAEYAEKVYNKFYAPEHDNPELAELILNTAITAQNSKLLSKIISRLDKFPLLQIYLFIDCKDLGNARKLIGKLPEKDRAPARFYLLAAEKKYDQAAKLFPENVKTHPFTASTVAAAANVAVATKDRKLWYAMRDFSGKNISVPYVANSIGYTAVVLGIELEYAEKILRDAVKKEPDNCAFLDSLAWCLYKRGVYAEAEKLIDYALETAVPSEYHPTIVYHAAKIKSALKRDKNSIRKLLESALYINSQSPDMEFDSEDAKRLLESLN